LQRFSALGFESIFFVHLLSSNIIPKGGFLQIAGIATANYPSIHAFSSELSGSIQTKLNEMLECTTLMTGASLKDVAVVLATIVVDTRPTEANVRCHGLVLRVPVAPIFAADSIMQARLHGDVFPRAIGGKFGCFMYETESCPWLERSERSAAVDPLSLVSLACMTVAQAIRDLGI
jgi:hypothetical protein